jgi:hypothetical protein
MTTGRLAALVAALLALAAPPASAEALRWRAMEPRVSMAFEAFLQTDHWIADAITQNLDGARLWRHGPEGRPLNFDPTQHLSWIVTDLNRDGRTEVILLFDWTAVTGNQPPQGLVLQQLGEAWRVACEFRHEAWPEGRDGSAAGMPLRLLDRRTHGWREFRALSGTYGWQPAPDGGGAMECVARQARR